MPPEEDLRAPIPRANSDWRVVAKNSRVNRDWRKLIDRHPENTRKCYDFLCSTPMKRLPGRIFPLKGKLYKGAWEYELTKGDRLFYVPDKSLEKVIVYYAGKHPKGKSPTP